MLVLGIESTCDEMGVSIVRSGIEILSNVTYSQIALHREYGGVFPEMAARKHVETFIPVLEEAMKVAGVTAEEIDLIAVAQGPGLVGSLLIGLHAAKTLALAWNKPLVGVNHVQAHLYAAMMSHKTWNFPALGVVISGGHTYLSMLTSPVKEELIGTTIDDAVGEAFDKVAVLLGLSYPGGPLVEKLAKTGEKGRFPLKAGRVKERPWDFSYSGLKTQVLYASKELREEDKAHLAASFQEVALRDVVDKATKAVENFNLDSVYVGGGVSNNMRLRELFSEKMKGRAVYFPSPELTLDNAAMIAGLGYHLWLEGYREDPLSLEPIPRIIPRHRRSSREASCGSSSEKHSLCFS